MEAEWCCHEDGLNGNEIWRIVLKCQWETADIHINVMVTVQSQINSSEQLHIMICEATDGRRFIHAIRVFCEWAESWTHAHRGHAGMGGHRVRMEESI